MAQPRKFDARDVLLPEHYRAELVASGFTLPTAVTFDERGHTYVLEAGYSNGELFDTPRLLELGPAGRRTVVAAGHNGPWTGIVYHQGAFYVAEGGELEGGRILRIEGGRTTPIVEGLPTRGDPRTNGPAIGPDGWLYFSVGTATNAAIAGTVLRVRMNGGKPELVAWGFRNPFGLAFAPDGNLYVSDNGYDSRGSGPTFRAADPFWRVDYQAPDQPIPSPLLGDPENELRAPIARFPVHSSSNGFDFSRSERFGFIGQAFVAQFGDQAAKTDDGMTLVGFKVVRVDPTKGMIYDFAVNRGEENGPASRLGSGGLERPVAARFDPSGEHLYVVDFGVLETEDAKARPEPGTGALWRISRDLPGQ